MKKLVTLLLLSLSLISQASSLSFGFSNPSFSGNGFSTHALSISQLEYNRSTDIEKAKKAAAAKAIRDEENTIVNKFITNVESRTCLVYVALRK